MIRKALIVVLAVLLVMAAALFAFLNPGEYPLDLGFAVVSTPMSFALLAAFTGGWLFGLGCGALWVLRLLRQRRRLHKEIRLAEAELANLRKLPSQDAG